MKLALDVMTEVYPVHPGQQLSFLLASSLKRQNAANGGGASEDAADRDAWRLDQPGAQGIAEEYDYVMYGKVRCRLRVRLAPLTARRFSSTTKSRATR